jgi:hypothetical protein
MYGFLKTDKVFTSKFVGTEPSSYKKLIYRAVISQSLRINALGNTKYLLNKDFFILQSRSIRGYFYDGFVVNERKLDIRHRMM